MRNSSRFWSLITFIFLFIAFSYNTQASPVDGFLDTDGGIDSAESSQLLLKLSSEVNITFDISDPDASVLRNSLRRVIADFGIQSVQPVFEHSSLSSYMAVSTLPVVDLLSLEEELEQLSYVDWVKPMPEIQAVFATDFHKSICPGQEINFYSESIGTNLSYEWSFEGANMETSQLANPKVYFNNAGTYQVSLKVAGQEGEHVLVTQIQVGLPTAKIIGGSEHYRSVQQRLSFELSGMPPYTIVYTDGSEIFELSGIEQSRYSLKIEPDDGTVYSLLAMQDNFCLGNVSGQAEYQRLPGGDPNDPEFLVQEVLVGGGCITVENVVYDGETTALGYYEQSANLDIGFESGVFMATGDVTSFDGPNDEAGASTEYFTPGDEDLETVLGGSIIIPLTNDAAVLEFDFRPASESISFEYLFASEEYPEYVCSDFNDVFAFFISGPGIVGPYSNDAINVALIPGTDIPVAINSVNPGVAGASGIPGGCTSLAYSEYYVDNTGGAFTEFDGYTTILTAQIDSLVPCETYHIKLAIADVFDSAWDSGVFLKANSFGADVPFFVEAIGVNSDPVLSEGCNAGSFVFTRGDEDDLEEPIEVLYSISGTATNGEDYESIPETLVIEPGEISATIPIVTIADDITEGEETIDIIVENSECNCESTFLTATLSIVESVTEAEAGPDSTICPGAEAQIDATTPDGTTFTWTPETALSDPSSLSPIAAPEETTEYVLTVTDQDGCFALDTVRITVAGAVELPDLEDISICTEDSEVEVQIEGIPENDNWSYVWEPADGLDDAASANPTATVSGPATFTLVVEDEDGCSGTTSVSMVATQITVDIEYDDAVVLCEGDEIVLAASTVAGASFLWQDDSTESNYTVSESGTYTVMATAGDCEASASVEIVVNPAPVVDLGPDQSLCGGEQIVLDATIAGDAEYQWMDGTDGPVIAVQGPGTYSVEVITEAGCIAGDSVSFEGEFLPTLNEDYFLICDQEEIESILVAVGDLENPTAGITYNWSTGEQGQSILIGPEDVGIIWVDVAGAACSFRDSLELLTYPCTILDVSLLSFSGVAEESGNRLNWVTASEIDSDYFELQRSEDGQQFVSIARIESAGNSNIAQNYTSYDSDVLAASYYRLRMMDVDGSVSYSKTILLQRGNLTNGNLSVWPIPANDLLELDYDLGFASEALLQVYDLTGQLIVENKLAATGRTQLDVSAFASGIYLLQISSEEKVVTSRVMVGN